MKRISGFEYKVVTGERINVDITAFSIPLMITAALDGQPLTTINQGRISFAITKIDGKTHFLTLSFAFLPDSPSDAHYKVLVTGDMGDESHSFVVERQNPHRDLVLVFRVEFGDTGPK
jgi:hypothetical protein